MEAWEKGAGGRKFGVDARWEHTIMIFDGQGNLVDSWNQYRLDAAAAALRGDQPL